MKNLTTLEIVKLAASIMIGSRVKGYGNQILVVTKLTKHGFCGYSEYKYKLTGKKSESVYLSFETLMNPHYNKNIEVLPRDLETVIEDNKRK